MSLLCVLIVGYFWIIELSNPNKAHLKLINDINVYFCSSVLNYKIFSIL